MPHNSLINSDFVCGLKNRNFETCNHHYNDLIRQIHATCTSHPSEWSNVRFAILTLEVEITNLLEEIPTEETNVLSPAEVNSSRVGAIDLWNYGQKATDGLLQPPYTPK